MALFLLAFGFRTLDLNFRYPWGLAQGHRALEVSGVIPVSSDIKEQGQRRETDPFIVDNLHQAARFTVSQIDTFLICGEGKVTFLFPNKSSVVSLVSGTIQGSDRV